jgi:hypothetical protein
MRSFIRRQEIRILPNGAWWQVTDSVVEGAAYRSNGRSTSTANAAKMTAAVHSLYPIEILRVF